MNIDSIKNGFVIDHITAGRAMLLFDLLKLEDAQCSIAIIKNVGSSKMGKKDIIKIDAEIPIDFDVLGYVDPGITVNIIRNGEICEPVRGATLVGKGSEIIQNIDMVGSDLDMAQGMCGASSGSVPPNVGQPMIRVSSITVGGR